MTNATALIPWPRWVEPARFATVGATGYALNVACYAVLAHAVGVDHRAAAVGAFLAAVTSNFLWNRRWTFRARDGRITPQAARFLAVSGATLPLTLGLLLVLVGPAGLADMPAEAVATIAVTPLSFTANRLWTFGPRRRAPAAGRIGGTELVPAPVALIAAVVVAVLLAFASGYGYHRDELYFLAAARHLGWAYPDQGPLTPLIARAMNAIAPGSLWVLRIPAALAAGCTVLLTGLLAREFGGRRRAQTLAAAIAAVAVIVLFTGHMLNTSTFDLLDWTAVSWLVVRAVRTECDRLWLWAGAAVGIGLLNKPLPVFLAVAVLAGLALSGPRRLLRNRYVWLAAAIALALWSPWLAWQAAHGWPQLAVSRSIAAGRSASSAPWWQIIPFQALLAGPVLAPVWIAGLVRLFRDRGLRRLRFLAWAWVLLAVAFMMTGGKPYYLAGLLPALIGAGAAPVDRWLDGGRRRVRGGLLAVALGASAAAGTLIALPVFPARDAGPVIVANPDVGETIGWPDLVTTVAHVQQRLPRTARVVILTQNYGEAGAIDRFGPAHGLPHAYSGHNAYGQWGPPPARSAAVIAVGFDAATLATHLRGCTVAARIGNAAGVDNDESGRSVALCRGPRGSWAKQWPTLRHLS